LENRLQVTLASMHNSSSKHNSTEVASKKELPKQKMVDVDWRYVRNPGCEKMTKQCPDLGLPKGTRYNMIIGSIQKWW